jgi:hypothetical protein
MGYYMIMLQWSSLKPKKLPKCEESIIRWCMFMMYIMTFSLLNMCFLLEVLVFMCWQGFLGKNFHRIFLFPFIVDGDIHSANFAKVEARIKMNYMFHPDLAKLLISLLVSHTALDWQLCHHELIPCTFKLRLKMWEQRRHEKCIMWICVNSLNGANTKKLDLIF